MRTQPPAPTPRVLFSEKKALWLKSKSHEEQGCLQQPELDPAPQLCFWGSKDQRLPTFAHSEHHACCLPSTQRRPYLLLLAASSSLIFLMSLLHFSISTTFSPSTGDKEKQGGYHGYREALTRLLSRGHCLTQAQWFPLLLRLLMFRSVPPPTLGSATTDSKIVGLSRGQLWAVPFLCGFL